MQLANEQISIEKYSGLKVNSNIKEEKVQLKIEAKDLDYLVQKFNDKSFDIIEDFKASNESSEVSLLGSKSVNSLMLQRVARSNS